MPNTAQTSIRPGNSVPRSRKRNWQAKDYIVPPIVVPLALALILLAFVLIRGPM